MEESDYTEQALSLIIGKLRNDHHLIETAEITAKTEAAERLTRALEQLIDARNRHTAALDREARALKKLDRAQSEAVRIPVAKRIPPQKVHRFDRQAKIGGRAR